MKKIPLTQGKFALVDDADFEWLNQWKWSYSNRGAGYAQRNVNKQWIKMHRLITDCPKGKVVDHINRSPLDNQRSNLRVCTQQQNSLNQTVSKNSKSGHKDIFWQKDRPNQRWLVQIMYKGKLYNGGRFAEIRDALIKRDTMILELHGEFARTEKVYV